MSIFSFAVLLIGLHLYLSKVVHLHVLCEAVCRSVLVLIKLWEQKSVHTVTLWGLAFLTGTKCKTPKRKSLHFRVNTWFMVRVRQVVVMVMVRKLM